MEKGEIFNLINANPAYFIATSEENTPHVRGVLVYRADNRGIIFHTGKSKDLFAQLQDNSRVELCFTNNGKGSDLIQIRVRGNVCLEEDMALKKQIVADRDFLKPYVEMGGYEGLAVFCLREGQATVWTMDRNLAEKTWINL